MERSCAEVMGMMNGGMSAWMLVWILLTVGLVVVGAGWLVRRGLEPVKGEQRPAPLGTVADPALELLRHRYAAGEIDEDEYLVRRSGLSEF